MSTMDILFFRHGTPDFTHCYESDVRNNKHDPVLRIFVNECNVCVCELMKYLNSPEDGQTWCKKIER